MFIGYLSSNFEVTLRRTLILGSGPNADSASPLQIDLQVTRSKASKMFVVLVVVSNCKSDHRVSFIHKTNTILSLLTRACHGSISGNKCCGFGLP